MKPSAPVLPPARRSGRRLRLSVGTLAAFLLPLLGSSPASAQDLPVLTSGLLLPPPPVEIASRPPVSRPPGLPGGPAPVFVPGSRLILPEKPLIAGVVHTSAALPAGGQDFPGSGSGPSVTSAGDPLADQPSGDSAVPEPMPAGADENPLLPPASAGNPGDLPPLLPEEGDGGERTSPENTDGTLFLPEETASATEFPATPGTAPVPAPGSEGNSASGAVPGSDLAPGPAREDRQDANPEARGPMFRVRGSEAFALAHARGFRFTPAGGQGRRDGIHTVASQVPNVLTSEVHGTRLTQLRPVPMWSAPYTENVFYMFCDGNYNAVRLTPGWKIRGIQLRGQDWQWVVCPRSGANTASFSIRIRAWKLPAAPSQGTVVLFHGLTLEGPPGATSWKDAFPDLTKPGAVASRR